MKPNGCPYRAATNKSCTHKGTKTTRGGKRVCPYIHPHNCIFFLQWIDAKINGEKSKIEASKPQNQAQEIQPEW